MRLWRRNSERGGYIPVREQETIGTGALLDGGIETDGLVVVAAESHNPFQKTFPCCAVAVVGERCCTH